MKRILPAIFSLLGGGAAIGTVLPADAAGLHFGWCRGVGNQHHTTGCAGVSVQTPIGPTDTGIVNTVPISGAEGPSTLPTTGINQGPVPSLPLVPPKKGELPIPPQVYGSKAPPLVSPRLVEPPKAGPTAVPPQVYGNTEPPVVSLPLMEPPKAGSAAVPPQVHGSKEPLLVPPRLVEPLRAGPTAVPPQVYGSQEPLLVPSRLVEPPKAGSVAVPPQVHGSQEPLLVPPRLVEPLRAGPTAVPPQVYESKEPLLVPSRLVEPPKAGSVAVPPQVHGSEEPPLVPSRLVEPLRAGPTAVPRQVYGSKEPPLVTQSPQSVTTDVTTLYQRLPTGVPGHSANGIRWMIVPIPGRQVPQNLHRDADRSGEALGHNECIVSGNGRRRHSQDEKEQDALGLVSGFHMTEAVARDLPLNRHLYSGCFIAVERKWLDPED